MGEKKIIKRLEAQIDDLQKYADSSELLTLTQEQANEILVLLKEQEEVISNYKETIENLLQQLQDIGKYMTPIGIVSDVRAYIEGRSQPEIIRCYACKHGEKCNSVYLCGKSRGFGIAHDPSWFCADGERKDT